MEVLHAAKEVHIHLMRLFGSRRLRKHQIDIQRAFPSLQVLNYLLLLTQRSWKTRKSSPKIGTWVVKARMTTKFGPLLGRRFYLKNHPTRAHPVGLFCCWSRSPFKNDRLITDIELEFGSTTCSPKLNEDDYNRTTIR